MHHPAENNGEELRLPRPVISEENRKLFEEGKMLLIDKPMHWTSFDLVRKLRGMLRIKKIGHAGTLDPLASGLMIICTGKFTKRINEFMAQEKEYTGTITLGAVTPTYDLESKPENPQEYRHLTNDQIMNGTAPFLGDILQYPPVFSAIKKAGTPLYELARRGDAVELEARPVHIAAFLITRVALPELDFRVVCSTGTYIRSLAHDYGRALGCGGYLSALRRTRIGEYRVEQAQTMDEFVEQWREKEVGDTGC